MGLFSDLLKLQVSSEPGAWPNRCLFLRVCRWNYSMVKSWQDSTQTLIRKPEVFLRSENLGSAGVVAAVWPPTTLQMPTCLTPPPHVLTPLSPPHVWKTWGESIFGRGGSNSRLMSSPLFRHRSTHNFGSCLSVDVLPLATFSLTNLYQILNDTGGSCSAFPALSDLLLSFLNECNSLEKSTSTTMCSIRWYVESSELGSSTVFALYV